MLTLFHAPQSRSSAVIQLLDELGALDEVTVQSVSIRRMVTGTGGDRSGEPAPGRQGAAAGS